MFHATVKECTYFPLAQALPLAVSSQHLSPIRVRSIAMQDHTEGCLKWEPILQVIWKRLQTDLGAARKGNMFSSPVWPAPSGQICFHCLWSYSQ